MEMDKHIKKVSCATVVKLEEDLLKVTVNSGPSIEIAQVNELSGTYDELVGPDKPFYVVTVLPEDLNPSKDLRDHWRSPERCKRKLAEAVVIKGTAMTIIANFVHKMEMPEHRVRYFKEEAEALAWIKKTRHRDVLSLAEGGSNSLQS